MSVVRFLRLPPAEKGDCSARLKQIASDSAHLAVFYESPNRIIETLEIMKEVFPEANAAVCNDITKNSKKSTEGRYHRCTASWLRILRAIKANIPLCLKKLGTKGRISVFS